MLNTEFPINDVSKFQDFFRTCGNPINVNSSLSVYLPLPLTHSQIPPDDVAPCDIIVFVSHYGILPYPVDVPRHITHDVVRQKNQLQPQNVKNARLLIAAAA